MGQIAERVLAQLNRAALFFAYLGCAMVFVQVAWTSYGVMMRYVFSNPDAIVTEATALLLFPVAFVGLAYALREDAYPRVTFLLDALAPRGRRLLLTLNYLVIIAVGVFFSIASVDATIKSFHSGAASEILLWPRYLFWAPSAAAIVLFSACAVMRLITLWNRPDDELKGCL